MADGSSVKKEGKPLKLEAALISMRSESSRLTVRAMRKYFTKVDDLDIRKINIRISGDDSEIMYDGKPMKKYDCIYAKGSYRFAELLKTLTSLVEKACYLPLSADSFTIAHDKLLTHLELQKHNIHMPNTYITPSVEAAKAILKSKKIPYPVMMKFPKGTGGKGVMFAESYEGASSILDALQTLRQPFVLQEYIDTGRTDYRVIVAGNKVIAAMKRIAAEGEARANYHSGGRGERIVLDESVQKLAVKVAKTIKAEICAVDILPAKRGPLVIEANVSPGIKLITETTGIDIADEIAKYLFNRTHAIKMMELEQEKHRIIGQIDFSMQKKRLKQVKPF